MKQDPRLLLRAMFDAAIAAMLAALLIEGLIGRARAAGARESRGAYVGT